MKDNKEHWTFTLNEKTLLCLSHTCKSSSGRRDAKITSIRDDHVFNSGAELIIIFIRSEAVIDENLKPLRIFRCYYSLEMSDFHLNLKSSNLPKLHEYAKTRNYQLYMKQNHYTHLSQNLVNYQGQKVKL